jgi:hypothetical protein
MSGLSFIPCFSDGLEQIVEVFEQGAVGSLGSTNYSTTPAPRSTTLE